MRLPAFALAAVLAIAALAIALQWGAAPLIFPAAFMIAAAMGLTSGMLFSLMMVFARPGLAALDYGVQSSLFILARTVVPMLAGILLDQLGHLGLLAGLLIGSILAFVLALRSRAWLSSPS